MCGICGMFNFKNSKPVEPVDENILGRMSEAIKHRGPDDEGYYFGWQYGSEKKYRIGLGIRRLALIGTKTGHQPIHNEDKTIWVIFNGNICNFISLRQQLQRQGHYFYTQTDTETIVHLYEQHGIKCLHYLRGMFTFALWDEKKKHLFIARDRMGEKPLVYAEINGSFYFSSEIKALLCVPEIRREIDYEALHHYFIYNYIPAPYAIFRQIRKLMPAHYMLISEGKIIIEKYWSCNYGKKWKASLEDYCQRYWEILEEAIKLRLISDVPLGLLCSGGVDSSTILAIMSKIGIHPIKTYAVGLRSKDPQLLRAKKVATLFKTEHHEYILKPPSFSSLFELISIYNEPINTVLILGFSKALEFVRGHVRILLAGNGGDELFGGYEHYNQILWRNMLYNIGKIFPLRIKSNTSRVGRFLHIASLRNSQRMAEELRFYADKLSSKLYSEEMRQKIKKTDVGLMLENAFRETKSNDFLDGVTNADLTLRFVWANTLTPDIAGMVNSLEIRAPLLDHKVAEFAASLPTHMKIPNIFQPRLNKYIMKKAMENIIPQELLYAPKLPAIYGAHWENYLRTSWREGAEDVLFTRTLSETGLFNMKYIKETWRNFLAGESSYDSLVLGLIIFNIWYEIYMNSTA
jgi:asparagine synthase (glutamine-hydrolysing)